MTPSHRLVRNGQGRFRSGPSFGDLWRTSMELRLSFQKSRHGIRTIEWSSLPTAGEDFERRRADACKGHSLSCNSGPEHRTRARPRMSRAETRRCVVWVCTSKIHGNIDFHDFRLHLWPCTGEGHQATGREHVPSAASIRAADECRDS